jgi:2-alkenal reductase
MPFSLSGNTIALVVGLFIVGLIVGGFVGYFLNQGLQTMQNQSSVTAGNNTQFESIYEDAKDSVVLIRSLTGTGGGQGSGFVYDYSGRPIIVTNYHVVEGANRLSVTFSNSQGYSASILGFDQYVDIAVLSVDAPADQFNPLPLSNSSELMIGENVLALGGPFGLAGSLSSGIVSAQGRTLTEEQSGINFLIANVIQVTAPINPGNSGGPLLNTQGEVVGITTAIIAGSQGLGFAIPSNTILREVAALVENGSYNNHPYLGISGEDMTYFLAQELGTNVTYGEIVRSIQSGGPSAGKLMVNDIIIGLNDTRITSVDDLAGYLEEKALPGDTVVALVNRNGSETNLDITLGRRPPIP